MQDPFHIEHQVVFEWILPPKISKRAGFTPVLIYCFFSTETLSSVSPRTSAGLFFSNQSRSGS